MNQGSKNSILWIALIALVFASAVMFRNDKGDPKTLSYSDFREAVEKNKVLGVTIRGTELTGEYDKLDRPEGDQEFKVILPPNDDQLVPTLLKAGVKVAAESDKEPVLLYFFAQWFPFIILIGIWLFFLRNMQMGSGKAMSFGKSKARLMEEGAQKITFKDVAGVEEAKAELENIVQFLKDPKKFTKLGGRIPKGVLLVGSPGTGKTLIAKAVAGEAGVPFFSISGSDFVEMFVGVGASRVRDLFLRGKKNAPCIIFIDEIDAVGRHRGAGLGGGHDEREQTLNQLLVEMDGFEGNEGVILVAATNRPDVLDPALLRPGRFDRTVVVPLPDIRGREAILKVHASKSPIDPDVSLTKLARGTPGFSGAELANLVNEAALYAALQDAEKITMRHFEYAKDKIIMGSERKSMILSDKERENTAYHESGHAIVARLVKHSDPVHKVTIVPRGVALGLMQQLPADEKHTYTKDYWLDRIAITFGGRAAEEIVFNQITTGASSDIQHATGVARKMICEWGMSERLGLIAYGRKDDAVFLGRELGHQRDYSEETASLIDEEVRQIIDRELERARKILVEHRDVLDLMAKTLLEKETIDAEQVDEIITKLRPGFVPSSLDPERAEAALAAASQTVVTDGAVGV